MKNTLLAKLLGLLTTANLSKVKPTRKIEADKESVLGTLPDEMQKLWIARKGLLDPYQEIAAKIGDQIACYKADLRALGKTGPAIETRRAEAVKVINTLMKEVRKADFEFHLVDHLFHGLLYADYRPLCPEDMEVVAVREGFQVIAREDDARGDWKTPREDISEELVGSGLVHTTTLNIVIRAPRSGGGDEGGDKEPATPPVVPDGSKKPTPVGA